MGSNLIKKLARRNADVEFELTGDLPEETEEKQIKAIAKQQYALSPFGYLPMGQTAARLPSGMFKLEVKNTGTHISPMKLVTDDLLILPDSRSDEVFAEIERFWTLKATFKKHGYSHKRGFLLHGPPGSGKTSTISLVTKKMVKDGGVVIMLDTHPMYLVEALHGFRQVEPDRPLVVVIEDIDALIKNHGEQDVLALLDGEASIDNVVFVATTNYPEDLDGRITNRPSRFDRVVEIGMPSAEARKAYIESRGLELGPRELQGWIDDTEDFSISHIKELIVGVFCFGNDYKEQLARLRGMVKTPTSTKSSKKPTAGFGAR